MEAHRRTRGELNFAGVAAIAFEHVDGAELVELAAAIGANAVLQVPWREVEILGAHQ